MKKNEKGFGVVELLVIVIVLGLLGAVGWLVWKGHNDTASQQPAVSTHTAQAKYFVIKEWGVKFRTNDKLSDLYYVYQDDNDPSTLSTAVDFSLNALKGGDCDVAKTQQFSIIRYTQTEVDKLGTGTMADSVRASTKLGGNYYAVRTTNNEVCSQDATVQNKVDAFRTELINAIPATLQLSQI